jgi:RecA/RadA recombinase
MNKFLSKLRKLEGAVNFSEGNARMLDTLKSPSPSVNWAFAVPGYGIPFGSAMLLYGPPKGGKSIITNAFVGQLHKDDPEAIAIKFDTEMRGAFQTNAASLNKWGIDPERFISYDVNQPENIFDRITTEIDALCQEGAKIKLIIIDSLSNIVGRRTMNATSILTQQMGDQALTLKDGLMQILPTLRRHGITLIATAHVRAEMDMAEQMRGKKVKMHASWATKHMFELFCYVEPNKSKDGKVTLGGEEFTDKETVDFMNKAQKTGHKVRFRVEESSFGFAGRTAEFTLDYNQGITNQYEEIFTLAVNAKIIERPNNLTYKYGDNTYRGLPGILSALKDNVDLQKEILQKVMSKDREIISGTN